MPPANRTGANGSLTCASSGCHTGAPQTGSGILLFNGGNNVYDANETYQLQIIVPANVRHGFQLLALNEANNNVGTFIVGTGTNIQFDASTGYEFINHFSVQIANSNTFNVEWNAPSSAVGQITFYLACLSGNGNSNPNGDEVFVEQLSVNYSGVGLNNQQQEIQKIQVYPNPLVTDVVNVAYWLSSKQMVSISVHNLQGRRIETLMLGKQNPGSQTESLIINRSKYTTGLYLFHVETENTVITKKIYIP